MYHVSYLCLMHHIYSVQETCCSVSGKPNANNTSPLTALALSIPLVPATGFAPPVGLGARFTRPGLESKVVELVSSPTAAWWCWGAAVSSRSVPATVSVQAAEITQQFLSAPPPSATMDNTGSGQVSSVSYSSTFSDPNRILDLPQIEIQPPLPHWWALSPLDTIYHQLKPKPPLWSGSLVLLLVNRV